MSATAEARPPRADRPAVRAFVAAAVGCGVLACAAGCSEQKTDATLDQLAQEVFAPRKSPEQQMIVAVSSDDPDLRRDALARLSRSDKFDEEWSIKGLVAIACLENDSQTRCVAIRALARTSDARAVETMLKILNSRDYPPEEVQPPTSLVRWDATVALANLADAGRIPPESADAARQTFAARLSLDEERHARIAGARGLGSCTHRESLDALIAGLRDEDFAVVHACEESLVRLTGRTHQADPAAWESWLAANESDAFAAAGETPESRRPPYGDPLSKAVGETRDLVDWMWPGPAR